jgi:ADP-ribose pyrophosphatase YjhB (NUDIX family)
MNFCSACGKTVISMVPEGDNRERFVCVSCDTVHYQNPNNVAGAILTWQDKVLLCKRAIDPRYGLWTLPAGFMENNETVAQAAARESMEEANAQCGRLNLFGVFSLPYISQVYMMFSGRLESDDVSPGMESLEVGLFARDQIPWDEIAFPVVTHSLELFFKYGAESGKVHHCWFSRSDDRVIKIHHQT